MSFGIAPTRDPVKDQSNSGRGGGKILPVSTLFHALMTARERPVVVAAAGMTMLPQLMMMMMMAVMVMMSVLLLPSRC